MVGVAPKDCVAATATVSWLHAEVIYSTNCETSKHVNVGCRFKEKTDFYSRKTLHDFLGQRTEEFNGSVDLMPFKKLPMPHIWY